MHLMMLSERSPVCAEQEWLTIMKITKLTCKNALEIAGKYEEFVFVFHFYKDILSSNKEYMCVALVDVLIKTYQTQLKI